MLLKEEIRNILGTFKTPFSKYLRKEEKRKGISTGFPALS